MPKTLAIERGLSFAIICSPFLILFIRIIKPFRILIDLFSNSIFRIFKFSPTQNSDTFSEEDLKMMLMSGELDGLIEEDEREMIDSVIEFGEKTVEEIMTPRTELEAYPSGLSQEELIDSIRKGTHSRVLIYNEDIDHIEGVLHVKDLLLNPNRRYAELIREAHLVPPKKELTALLREMQRSHSHMAIVGDEYGGTAGIVTINDLLEEIVGDIKDAREAARETKEIIRIGPDHYNLAGKVEVAEVNEALDLNWDEDVARTISGFVFNTLGRLPSEGEEFDESGWHFRIMKMDGNRIDRISIKKLKHPEKPVKSTPESEE
jgi:putative hemolysin